MAETLTQADKTSKQASGRREPWNEGSMQPQQSQPPVAEGTVARTIEQQTVQIPSDWFLWAAGASIVGSLVLHCSDRKEDGVFVGQWAPTLLILGLYNKMVKLHGSDGNHLNQR
ncbi:MULTISPECIES: hypothetical protein [unclassified Schlesneria]|uniref:hypothetical protein n=1 Tax=Schlesneria TaxID=656899 RepID=UPI002F0D518E